jgi:hypothetical protein
MTQRWEVGAPKFIDIKKRVYDMIPDNTTNPMNPHLIVVRTGGTNVEYVKLIVYRDRSPWHRANEINVAAKNRVVWNMSAYVGRTERSSIYTRLPLAIEARDFFNMLHRIQLGKQRVTPEMIKSITSPHLRLKLIEACCMAAL